MGIKKVFKKIGSFFKKAFVAVFGSDAAAKFAEAAKAMLKSAFGSIVIAVVQELDEANLSSAEKREEAVKRIALSAIEQGLNVKESFIRLMVEIAVQRLRGAVPE